jgi:hypothetical protein
MRRVVLGRLPTASRAQLGSILRPLAFEDGRNRTRLLEGPGRYVADVKAALARLADDAPVHGRLCFVAPAGLLSDIGLAILRTLKIDGYALCYPRRLAKRLNKRGSLTPERANLLHAELGSGCRRRCPADPSDRSQRSSISGFRPEPVRMTAGYRK